MNKTVNESSQYQIFVRSNQTSNLTSLKLCKITNIIKNLSYLLYNDKELFQLIKN